jgi:hypothetical protein
LRRNVFEPEVEELTGGWKELHYEELHNLFSLPSVAIVIKSKSIMSVGHILRLVGVGVHLGPLGTSATSWPILRTPGDYEDGEFGGMMIGKGNRSTRRKPAPVPLCPPQIPHDLTECKPGPPQWEAGN